MRATYQRAAGALCLLLATGLAAQAPAGYVTVSGSHVGDASGVKVASATIAFAPVNNSGQAISFKVGGAGGQVISAPVSTTVTNGVFSIQLADTALTSPVNVCYKATIVDNVTGNNLLGPGYTCVQPAASGDPVTGAHPWCTGAGACNWDNYTPNLAGLIIVQAGPVGPTGPPGPPGVTGPPGGSLSYPGVGSDGTNGLSVAGAVTAGKVCLGTACTSSYGADLQPDSTGQQDAAGALSSLWGINAYGDSNCIGFGQPAASYGWADQLAVIAGQVSANKNGCQSGDNIADFAFKAMIYGATTDESNAATFVAIGTNSTRFGTGITAPSYANAATAELMAGLAKVATSTPTDQYYVTNSSVWTATGAWTTQQPWISVALAAGTQANICSGDTFSVGGGAGEVFTVVIAAGGVATTGSSVSAWGNGYATASNVTGILITSPLSCTGQTIKFNQIVGPTSVLVDSTAGDTLVSGALYVGPSGTVYFTYPIWTAYGGTFSISAAPVSTGVYATLTDTVTGSSTLSEAFGTETLPANAPTIYQNTSGIPGPTAKLARFTGLTQGQYIFRITVLSGTVGASHLTIPPSKSFHGVNGPHAVLAGIVPAKANQNATNIAFYNTLEKTATQTMMADGLYTKFASGADAIDYNRDLIDHNLGIVQNCQTANDTTGYHLDSCGHIHLAHKLANAAHLTPVNLVAKQLALGTSFNQTSFTTSGTTTVYYLYSTTAQTVTLGTPAYIGQVVSLHTLNIGTWTVAAGAGMTLFNIPTSITGTIAPCTYGSTFTVQAFILTQWYLIDSYCTPGPASVVYGSVANQTNNYTLAAGIAFVYAWGTSQSVTLPANGVLPTGQTTTIIDAGTANITIAGAQNGIPSTLAPGCAVTVFYMNGSPTNAVYPTSYLCPTKGVATLISGTVTVNNIAACAPATSCFYRLSNCGIGASTAVGTPVLGTVTAGTSFVINSESAAAAVVAGDVSKICWAIN